MGSPTARTRRALAGLLVAAVLVVAGCSSDGSDGASSSTRAASSSGSSGSTDGGGRTTTTGPRPTEPTTSTTAAEDPIPTTTVVPPSGGPTSFRGVIDGQPKVAVTFRREGSTLQDLTADGVEVVCQPVVGTGPAQQRTVDVRIAAVPVGADGAVSYTQADAGYQPSITGQFTNDGRFAGSLFLSNRGEQYACGGEFTFIAVHG